MRKDLIDKTTQSLKLQKQDLIEKDIIIHELLTDLSKKDFFIQNLIFKGGTCLAKAFLGYYRFSVDIDFTWQDQSIFNGKTNKERFSEISKSLETIGQILEASAKKRNLDFKYDKTDTNYVIINSGGKMCTLNVWYNSEINEIKDYVKIQLNFIEKLCFNPNQTPLNSLTHKIKDDELSLLFSGSDYLQKIEFHTYSVTEILCEKIRAILTRQGTKARDFLDVFLICSRLNLNLDDYEEQILEKLFFSLDLYEKYRTNMEEKIKQVESGNLFTWGDEKYLLLEDIDEKQFYVFMDTLKDFLKKIISKTQSR